MMSLAKPRERSRRATARRRRAWRLWLCAVVTLGGCQNSPAPSLLRSEPAYFPAARADAGLPAYGTPVRHEVQSGPPGYRDQGTLIRVSARGEQAQANQPQQPEVLPPPEKVEEPGSGKQAVPPSAGPVSLTLPKALATSLTQNPDLVALRGQPRVNQAMVGVARTYIWNPFVQAQFLPQGQPFVHTNPGVPASGAGLASFYVWVMQRFELAHQRKFRTRSALAALDQAQWNVFQAELLNVARTTGLYFAALYQKELYELAAESAKLNRRIADIVERRFKANLARAADRTTANVAARQALRTAELAEASYTAALLALRQQLNLPLTTSLDLPERLDDVRWLSLLGDGAAAESTLAEELVEGRPDVMAAQAGFRVAEANWRLARAALVPDVQAGPIYDTADDGTRYLGFRFQMDLPVWNTGRPLMRQRRAEMNQSQLTADQLRVRARLEAQTAIDQYERVRRLVAGSTTARSGGLPPELKEITRLFEAGQADILAVLATQTTLLQERRVHLDLLNQLALSAAAVIQFTGLPPNRVLSLGSESCPDSTVAVPLPPAQPQSPRKSS